jgi:hypothetical protein
MSLIFFTLPFMQQSLNLILLFYFDNFAVLLLFFWGGGGAGLPSQSSVSWTARVTSDNQCHRFQRASHPVPNMRWDTFTTRNTLLNARPKVILKKQYRDYRLECYYTIFAMNAKARFQHKKTLTKRATLTTSITHFISDCQQQIKINTRLVLYGIHSHI